MGAAHDCSAAAVALAWLIRGGNVIAIPELGSALPAKENVVALSLTSVIGRASDNRYSAPRHKRGSARSQLCRNPSKEVVQWVASWLSSVGTNS